MRRLILALAVALIATPALAQEAMTGAEFDAYTRGKTLLYGYGGEAYGGEDYLPNNRVRWSFLDGRCQSGSWYAENRQICFVYDGQSDPICWAFYETPTGLIAELTTGTADQQLYETGEADAPLYCLGPEVGV